MSEETRPNDRNRLDIDEIKRFLVRRWTVIVLTALGCVVLATMVCVAITPVYTATSQVLVDSGNARVANQDTVDARESSIVDGQIPVILSNRLLAKVVAKENLANDPEFDAPKDQGILDRLFGMFRAGRSTADETPTFAGIDSNVAPVVFHLLTAIDVTRVAMSDVLSISVSSRDPAKAMRLANTLAETYVEDQIDVHAKSVQRTATFFEQRLGRLREHVRDSERNVADFRKANNLTTTSPDGRSTVGEQQPQSLNEELGKLSADSAEKLARYQQAVRFTAGGTNLERLPEIIRSPVISQLRAQQADLSRRESDLSAMYGPAYPAITQIRAQHVGIDRSINAEIKRLTSTWKNDYEVANARETSLRTTIAGLFDVSGGDNEVGVKLRELERTNLANKALFDNFLVRAKLTQEQSSFEAPDARLISSALVPASPASPKVKLILLVAAMVGLLLGLGLAALTDAGRKRDFAPSTAAQANAFILGRVPTVLGREGDLATFMETQPNSGFARSIDALADKLAAGVGTEGRIVTLSPLRSGEGATTLGACLAEAAGKTGRRVLLIDASPPRRGLSSLMNAAGQPGLSEVVRGEMSANKAVVRRPRFAFLPIGQKPFALADATKPFQAFLQETRTRFDLVLIDAPPFDTSDDALALGILSDGFALVASWDQLMRETFIAAIDTVADKPTFAGIILNRTAASDEDEFAIAS